MLSRVVTSIYDGALRPLGVSTGQVNHLVALARVGPISTSGLAGLLALEASTASRNLERMLEQGWVRRATGSDARRYDWTLTRSGEGLLKRILPVWRKAQEEVEGRIGAELTQALASLRPGSPP